MRYEFRPPTVPKWSEIVTDSLTAEIQAGRLEWEYRIRREGESREWSVLQLAEAEIDGTAPPVEISDESRSFQPPVDALCYLLVGDQQTGPYTPDQIRSMWLTGQVTAETLYWFAGLQAWFPARNFCARSAIAQTALTSSRSGNSQGAGFALALVGLIIAGYFFFLYDTSVETETHYIAGYGTVGGERVHNLGLMQNRTLGCVGGLVLTIAGVVVLVVSHETSSRN